MAEKLRCLNVEEVRSWADDIEVGTLRTSFLDKVAGITTFEMDGALMCANNQLEKVFRGSVFHEMIIGVLSEQEIPSRGMVEE